MNKFLLGLLVVSALALYKLDIIFASSEPEFQRSSDSVLGDAMAGVERLCLSVAGGHSDSVDYYNCLDTAYAFEDICKQRILSQIPEKLTSPHAVSENQTRMQSCVIPGS
ncbi:hypothetical protein [Thalassotalea sp. PS06]|uniref:hypothetical protein n=1 Tax=Thalassotalea sp. PS06 TaxID=2594005 RepID=UPI00116534F4|nr:hypothetical protein [Thalassotalea sp. PS06]QDP00293.1 hypothetical protein FNC98_02365 [Thalassotalea sp. PS06]